MLKRKSNIFLIFLALSTLLVCIMLIHATVRQHLDAPLLSERSELVRVLGLTDLCLFTEARYTRHPSITDLHSPFQDHPMSLEHFPSGSVMAVPPHLKPGARR